MPPSSPRLRILSVGGNSVSAFLSWRLSATQACDVTLVWKTGFEAVYQYGISFRSDKFGNERFKPRHVVKTPDDAAATSRASFDYVLLCVKALPDVYDLAAVIESVVAPQHTCILVNTTNTIGIESYLEQRFPTNVVLSLVSGVEITQLGPSEFEHKGSTDLFVGAANKNPSIPASIQGDMAEALSMTLKSGQVDCEVSTNIRQQQYERMIGPIAFYPTSVLFETSSLAELLEKNGVRSLITGLLDELIALAKAQGCDFRPNFLQETMEKMIASAETNNIMYQDYAARRPLEVETYLGAPMKLAKENNVAAPRIDTMYALLHNANVANLNRPPPQAETPIAPDARPNPGPRMSSAPVGHPNGTKGPYGHGPMNGPPPSVRGQMRPGTRGPASGGPPPRGGRPSMNGYPPRMNGNGYHPQRGPPGMARRPSLEGNDFEEFSHLMLYEAADDGGYDHMASASTGDLTLRERELALRQKELALREREFHMRRGPGRGGRMQMPPPPPRGGYDEDEEDGEDYFDPMAPSMTQTDADNFDMMSVTSRRTRKAPSAGQLRANPEMMGGGHMRQGRGPPQRPPMKNRTSAAIMADMPSAGSLRDTLMNNPLVGYSSDRFATVDRMNLGHESRTNSLTAERLHELQQNGPPTGYGPPGAFPTNRRGSQSPGNPLMPGGRPPPPRQSPPNGYGPGPGPGPNGQNGRPSPPGMRQPMPRHPPNRGNGVPPQPVPVEQANGVSNLYPPKSAPHSQVRSLTGSASASAGSGDSNRSAPLDSEPSAHSSSSSLGPRPPIGVR